MMREVLVAAVQTAARRGAARRGGRRRPHRRNCRRHGEAFAMPPESDDDKARIALARPGADRRRAGPAQRGARDFRRIWVSSCRWSPSPRGRTAMPGGRPSFCPAATRSSCRRAIRCSISSNGCATRRIVLPSVRTGRGASATCARPGCRRSPASARRRKRALLHHFGTLKAIERASVTDLMQVDGISAETARADLRVLS